LQTHRFEGIGAYATAMQRFFGSDFGILRHTLLSIAKWI